MNLFALTRDATRRIVRLELSKEVQTAVENTFKQQEKDFNSSAQEEIDFNGIYKPDDGESLAISDYADTDGLSDAISNPIGIPEIRADTTEFENIKALFSGYKVDGAGSRILIQSFDRRKIISTKGLSLFHSANVFKRVEGVGVTLDTKLSIILDGKKLRFFSFHVARQILDLEKYYREATDEDLKTFSEIKTFKGGAHGSIVAVSDGWIRRKVSLVMQSGVLEKIDIEEAKATASIFKISLKVEEIDGKKVIVLPEEKSELKKVLKFLDEDYYQSALLKNAYMTNSKLAL